MLGLPGQYNTPVRNANDVIVQREFDAANELAMAFPLRVFPDAVGLAAEGREKLLLYGDLGVQHTWTAKRSGCQRTAAARRPRSMGQRPKRPEQDG